jgi:hypothetical protein
MPLKGSAAALDAGATGAAAEPARGAANSGICIASSALMNGCARAALKPTRLITTCAVKCGQTGFIGHRDGNTMLCRRCYRKPATVCGTCGGQHQCWRSPDGRMICSTCAAKQRAKEPCAVCGQLRQVHVRTDTRTATCDRCGRKREPCARCGKILPVYARLPEVGPLCSACLKREPASSATVCNVVCTAAPITAVYAQPAPVPQC